MVTSLRSVVGGGLVGLLLATATGHAQQTPPAPAAAPAAQTDQSPVFRAGINYVRVDVIVSDKNGNPIENLKAEDFEVLEEGRPQKIDTFKLISLDGGLIPGPGGPPRQIRTDGDEETEAARDDVRLFAIFLDDYHVRLETSLGAREQVARFVETQLGPSDMVGLMYPLDPMASVRMTRNHDAIVKAVQQFRGRKYDYTPRNAAEERYAYYPAETVEKIRNQVSMSALKALILRMGGLKEGRKALILVSEGYNAMLPPQMRDPVAAMPGVANPSRDDPDAGMGSIAEDRASFTSAMDMESDLQGIWDLANKNNVAIYAVDPRGLAVNEFGVERNINGTTDGAYLNSAQTTLRTLALQTEGRAIVNRNDLTIGMKQIIRDSSAYYLLGYNSTFTATDGKFHAIKVNVRRPGVQIRARKGYWAFTTEDAARATAPPKPDVPTAYSTALAAIAPPSRARVVRTWIGTSRSADGKTRVTFLWEPLPKTPGEATRNTEVPARVSLIAVGPDGTPYFRGRVPAAPAASPGASLAAGSRVSFDVPPGKMQLRLSIESLSADVLDSEVREIDVPNLSTAAAAIGTPQVFRARTVREYQQLKADAQSTPTAVREFTRAERLLIRVPAYVPGVSAPVVSARLLNRTGQLMTELPVSPSVGSTDSSDIEVLLASIPTGEYLVEIVVTATGESTKDVLGFRVTS